MKKVSKIKTLLCVALTVLCVGCLTAFGVAGSKMANAASVDGFEMVLGSSIRTTGETGLRFQAELPSSLYKSDSTYGMFIAPEDYVSANALDETNLFGANAVYDWAIDGTYTGNKKRIINVTYSADELQASGGKYLIKGSILNVKESNLGRKFVGRAYVKTASGEITLASYASGHVENNTRSLYDVAFSVVGDETQDSATVNFASNNYIDGMTKIVELAASDDYVEFISVACDGSESTVGSQTALTSIPSGYTSAWSLLAEYGENYHFFGNVDLDSYSILKFKMTTAACSFTGWGSAVTDWIEVKFVKTSTGWQGYRDGVKNDSWTVTGDFSSFNVGLCGGLQITELRGVKIPKFVPKYVVTYIDDNCQIIGTEKVSKGSAASASVELGSATVDGYTYEYANEWVLKDGSIADLSNVTSDMTVYPYGSAIAYKTYGGTVSSSKSVESNYDNLNDFLGIENGKFEVYIRPTEFTTIGLMGLVDWNNPVAYPSAKAGVWYKLVIEFGSDGVANAEAIYEDGVSILTFGADAVKGTYSTSKGIYVQVLNGAADIGAYIDGSTAKRHQVVYHDENGEILASKIVKEGESAMTKYQMASEVIDGYTYEYSNVAWLDSFGDPIDVANVTNVTSDLNLYLSADKIAWKAYEDNNPKNNTIVNKAYDDAHDDLTAITNGTIEVYVRMYADGKIGFMELSGWDMPMATFVGAGVYKMTLVMENGKGVSGSIVDVATGEAKATLDATNAARYDANAGIWISVQKTITDWTNRTYAATGKADVGVKATAVVEKNLALAVYNQYEQSKVQKDEGGRVNVYAVGEAVEFYEKITGKNLDVYYVDSLSDLPENEKFIVLGSELAALNGYTLTGLMTDTGYKITKDGDDVYLYGKTGYSTLNALYDLFNQTFGLEFFTDVVYTWDTAISSFDVSSVASKTFNPSIDKNWFHGAMEYIAPGETQPNWDYTHRLGFVNGWQEMSGGYHNFLNVLPYDIYKDAHPNWYTTASTPTESFTTLNLAYGLESADNNAMVNAVAQYIYDEFVASDAANNARDTFVFGQPDAFGWSASTQSAAIKAKYGTNSAEAILFMKKVAERFDSLVSASTSSLSTENRQFRLVIMAYGPTNEAPTAQTIASNANLDDLKFYNSTKVKMGVMYCPIESNLYRTFDDETAGYSEHNVDSSNVTAWTTAYARPNTFYKQQMNNWKALLNGGDMLMYYYSAHYDNYFAPLDSVTNMQSKYALFASLGVTDLYNLGQSGDDVYTDWTAFKVYMESKYAQDVNRTDSDALKTKFFKAYYGAAWQTMLNLYNAECEQYAAIADYYKKLQVADKQIGNWVLTHKDLNSDPSGCHLIRSFLFDKACWDSDGTILAGYCSSIDTALGQVEANSAEYDRIVVEGLVFRYLYYGMYGNSTYGDMAAIAADAKRVGIDKIAEGDKAYTITAVNGSHYNNSSAIDDLA